MPVTDSHAQRRPDTVIGANASFITRAHRNTAEKSREIWMYCPDLWRTFQRVEPLPPICDRACARPVRAGSDAGSMESASAKWSAASRGFDV